jgi:DNA-binding NtrC family response regulator|tara:strand:+ start:3651 stop:4382 length:732 start_codon:yes stop_codon:yes gene_type:complete
MTTNKEVHRLSIRLAAYRTTDDYMKLLLKDAVTLSFRSEPVLITGDTGTGKEIIANLLHGTQLGDIVTVNTTAVTDTLFESELFGHLKGSFTGAFRDRKGLVDAANNGTLFLDEIGDMPISLQAKILRLVQFGTYRTVGDNKTQKTNCRIIAATCKPIDKLIAEGMFRDDLYYRLSTFRLHITSLAQRRHDAEHFFVTHPLWRSISDEHKAKFITYANTNPIKGNYRELEQLMLQYEVLKLLP